MVQLPHLGHTSLAFPRRLSVAHGEVGLSAFAAFMTYPTQLIQLTSKKGVAGLILARPTSWVPLPGVHIFRCAPPPLRPLAPPVHATAPSPAAAELPPTWAGGAATPTCPFPQPLGSPGGVPCGGKVQHQQFPLCPLWVMELFQLGLHLCLRSQWLRSHPHTSARRLRPWCLFILCA